MGLYLTKKLSQSKIINKVKRQPVEEEKMFANHVSGKELISKYAKTSTVE